MAFGFLDHDLSEADGPHRHWERGWSERSLRRFGRVRVCPDDCPCFCRWETTPWTACSSSCGGGLQSRAVSCVEEDIQGHVTSVEEWKCMYTPKMPIVQPCNIFDCPKWLAQEWSPVTVPSFLGRWEDKSTLPSHRHEPWLLGAAPSSPLEASRNPPISSWRRHAPIPAEPNINE